MSQAKQLATYSDLVALGEDVRAELIAGNVTARGVSLLLSPRDMDTTKP